MNAILSRAAWLIFCAGCLLASRSRAAGLEADLSDYGAVGDGHTDNAPAFQKALATGARVIHIPAGTFALSKLVLPEGTLLTGLADKSVLVPIVGPDGDFIDVSSDSTLSHFKISGNGAKKTCVSAANAAHITADGLIIQDFDGVAVRLDHADDALIEHCSISKVKRATDILFSQHIRVLYNTVANCTEHGIQFWGNWKWQQQNASDLQFIGNQVTQGGRGAIWGSGAVRVVIAGNIINGADDVGLDLEWCADASISGNVVRGAKNAGIGLFFACQRVAITGNTIVYDEGRQGGPPGTARWKPSGIWLTDPNPAKFPQDKGHRDVAICGNCIVCAVPDRGGIWIGTDSDNVSLFGNAVRGGGIWRGQHGADPVDLTNAPAGTTIRAGAPGAE